MEVTWQPYAKLPTYELLTCKEFGVFTRTPRFENSGPRHTHGPPRGYSPMSVHGCGVRGDRCVEHALCLHYASVLCGCSCLVLEGGEAGTDTRVCSRI